MRRTVFELFVCEGLQSCAGALASRSGYPDPLRAGLSCQQLVLTYLSPTALSSDLCD
jgi:hypothetical protein